MNSLSRGYVNLILAAGHAQRFGSDKRLVVLHDTCRSIINSSKLDTFVLLKASDQAQLKKLCICDIPRERCIFIEDSQNTGLGASLACGVKTLWENLRIKGAVVYLGDMPFLKPETIIAFEHCLGKKGLTAACYQHKRGHPVAFAQKYFSEILSLTGDAGAKRILEKHASDIMFMDTCDPGVVADVDTPEDLHALRLKLT